MAAICNVMSNAAKLYLQDASLAQWLYEAEVQSAPSTSRFSALLTRWSQHDPQQPDAPRPTVLMLDEVDALVGDTLISLLRQIRAGYAQRPEAFPQTVILCGVRDVRDYRIHTPHQEIITGGSAFNIKTKSLRLGNLSQEEAVALWMQGQVFDDRIWPELWEDTRGQPWVVNALGLIRLRPELTMANRIYREVLPREITSPIQSVLHYPQPWFLTPQRQLDMPKLLSAFQQFFREHSDAWMEGFNFKEAGPHLWPESSRKRFLVQTAWNGEFQERRTVASGKNRASGESGKAMKP